jgi:hypothetical protein
MDPCMSARPPVDRGQSVDSGLNPFLCPAPFGHIMIDLSTHGVDHLDDPVRLAKRGDEEADPLLKSLLDPTFHSLSMPTGRGIKEDIHSDRAVRERLYEANTFNQLISMNISEGVRLNDSHPSTLAYCSHQLRI